MIKYLLIFLLPFSLYGAKILNYNVYDRTDRVDIMVTFDAPFKGIIKQSRKKSKIIIKLYDAEIESSKIKKLSTQFVKSLTITPMFEYTQIVVNVPSSISLVASKTSDAYGLRLRFINPKLEKKTPKKMENEEPKLLSSLPTKSDDTISQRYYIVITLLIIGIITLLILKKKIIKKSEKQEEPNPWLFKENSEKQTGADETNKSVSIRFQKSIDDKNSVIMLDFGKESYLILMGNGNILIDKFIEEKPTSQKGFEEILEARSLELNQLLRQQDEEKSKEPLEAYKEKASSINEEV